MKKLLFILLTLGYFSQAQVLVSTSVENKNVLLEEITAYRCGICPEGHYTAKLISNNYPEDFVSIRIHANSLANPTKGDPDLRSDFGQNISDEASIASQPSGLINRHSFSGSSISNSLQTWVENSEAILEQTAIVNIGAIANINTSDRTISIEVEIYYLGSQNTTTNKINIALLQNNIEAPQANYDDFNLEDYLENGNYLHNHVLRHLITGQWGEEITTIDQETLISLEYEYEIEEDYKGVAADLNELDLAIFITEDKREVLNAISVQPTIDQDNSSTTEFSSFYDLKVSPNPAKDFTSLSLTSSTSKELEIIVTDITGKTFNRISKNISAGSHKLKIPLPYQNGIYMIHVSDGALTTTQKVILLN